MFDFVLNPISTDKFFDEYFEKKHLVIKRQDRSYFQDVLTCEMLDDMLFSMNLYVPQHRVIDNSKETFPEAKTYTIKNSQRIDPLKFTRYYAEGSTLVFSGAQERLYQLRRLTNEVESFFKHNFQSNIYLTPRNSQGFSPHYDTHDVFILQFEGSKTWRIYDSNYDLADKTVPFEKGVFEVGNVVEEFTLEQGDTLYIPRGVMHDAFCDDQNSGHITLGMMGSTWAEQLATLLMEESKNHAALRKYVKFHKPGQKDEVKDVLEIIKGFVDSLETNPDVLNTFYSKQKSLAKGQLVQTIKNEAITGKSKVSLRERHKVRVTENGDDIDVMFYDTKVSFPAYCKEFMNTLMKAEAPIEIENIFCNLDEEGKLVLTKELAKQGVIHIGMN